jgi:hypothetical protein
VSLFDDVGTAHSIAMSRRRGVHWRLVQRFTSISPVASPQPADGCALRRSDTSSILRSSRLTLDALDLTDLRNYLRNAVLGLLLALLLGCCGDSDKAPFALHIVFGGDLGGAQACEQSCDAYDMPCGGHLGIRIANGRRLDEAYYFNCIAAPPAPDACSLSDLHVSFGLLPAGPAHVEVALWPAAEPGGQPCINESFFDLQGEPLPVIPAPAIAGAVYIDLGTTEDVYVPMACVAPAQLSRPECRAP